MFGRLFGILGVWIALMAMVLPGGARAAVVSDEGARVAPPAGFVDFCRRHAADCDARSEHPERTRLTTARLAELVRVQTSVNRDVAYRPDSYTFGRSDYWEYPFVYGDCEDIALKKRRDLVRLGWPRENLSLALVALPDGRLHMVLVVATHLGDLVLDNLHRQVTVPEHLGYRWLSRQSRHDESAWVTVAGPLAIPHL